ncbi:MAG: hypothetical protein H0V51_02515 [Chloroflexi bacterium]|nr:hypothetical protein [Chloroflexota bacterium]
MALNVQDFHDLVRLLEQRPEWRAEPRRLVLTDELLALPAVVRELAEAQQHTEERLGRLEEGQARLTAAIASLTEAQQRTEMRIDRLEQQVHALVEAQQRTEQEMRALAEAQRRTEEHLDRVETRLERVEQHVGDLRGNDRERRYREHADAYFGRLLRRVRLVLAAEIDDLLEEGLATEVLDEDTFEEVRWADVIVRGRRLGEDQDTYLVVEVSVTIDAGDVEQATQRAALLGRLRPTLAVVAGDRLTSEAAARGVWQVLDGWAEAPRSSA